MSDLTTFRDHARAMAAAGAHLPGCESLEPARRARPIWQMRYDEDGTPVAMTWLGTEPAYTPPRCDGCIPEADRELFARMAGDDLGSDDEPLWGAS